MEVEHGVTGNTGLGEPLNSVAKVKVAAKPHTLGVGFERVELASALLSLCPLGAISGQAGWTQCFLSSWSALGVQTDKRC